MESSILEKESQAQTIEKKCKANRLKTYLKASIQINKGMMNSFKSIS